MSSLYVPSSGPDAWRQFLAKPDLHWARGFSARTLAHSWEAATGLPPEIAANLEPALGPIELLLAFPEHKTRLPGGRRESQSDVFALVRSPDQLIAMTVEGKVDEPFGPTVGEWLEGASAGKLERLHWITRTLGLPDKLDPSIRYQLLHRTASAIVEAERFQARTAAMVVHSFSPTRRWFEDFAHLVSLLCGDATDGAPIRTSLPNGKALLLAWVRGDEQYLQF